MHGIEVAIIWTQIIQANEYIEDIQWWRCSWFLIFSRMRSTSYYGGKFQIQRQNIECSSLEFLWFFF